MSFQRPSNLLVDRVVKIWKHLLRNPSYDNGDKTMAGVWGQAAAASLPNNLTDKRLDDFGVALKKEMLTAGENGFYNLRTGVDYGPGRTLAKAGEVAGIEMEWPYKTDVSIYDGCVCVRAGYSAEPKYHYPINKGKRWLITTLTGSDIEKVIDYVNGGLPTFEVEESKDN